MYFLFYLFTVCWCFHVLQGRGYITAAVKCHPSLFFYLNDLTFIQVSSHKLFVKNISAACQHQTEVSIKGHDFGHISSNSLLLFWFFFFVLTQHSSRLSFKTLYVGWEDTSCGLELL